MLKHFVVDSRKPDAFILLNIGLIYAIHYQLPMISSKLISIAGDSNIGQVRVFLEGNPNAFVFTRTSVDDVEALVCCLTESDKIVVEEIEIVEPTEAA